MAKGLFLSRVLVPLDGSSEAQRSLEPALRIARPLACPLELVTIHDPVHDRWARDIDEVAERLDYERVEAVVVGGGWSGDIIVEMVAEQPGTLVCMASHERGQIDRLVLGSVSAHVIRNSREPVLLVGPRYQPASTAQARYHRLVVCLDGSPLATTALDVARTWARFAELDVELVHVASPDVHQTALDATEAELERTTQTMSADRIRATYTVLTDPDPATGIASLLSSRADAIAVTATHARSGLIRLLLGSVTAELLTRSPTPVLITRGERHGATD